MRNEKLRELKRTWLVEPSVEVESQLIREGLRQGVIYDTNIAVLAMLHHEPSRLAMGASIAKLVHSEHVLQIREPRDVIDSLGLWDRKVAIMAACGVAHELYSGKIKAIIDQIVKLPIGEPEGIKQARALLTHGVVRTQSIRDILLAVIQGRRHHAINALRSMSIKMEDQEFFEASWHYILPLAMEGIICA